jgi:magnesium transporter
MDTKRIRKTGLPPGSLIYTGVNKSDEVIKDYIRYKADAVEEIAFDTTLELHPDYLYWLDVRGTNNPAEIEAIGQRYNIDSLVLEDILDPGQRPKFEQGENSVFIVLKNLIPGIDGHEFLSEHISLYMTENLLITFQEYPDNSFSSVKVRLSRPNSRIQARRIDYLMYAITDFITDHYFSVLDICSDRINVLEDEINRHPDQELKNSIYHLRQDITEMHRIILPSREVIGNMLRTDSKLISEKTKKYLRDLLDNIMQIIDINDNQSDHISSLHDLFMSEMTYKMTNVMRILTVVTSIFIPLTVITSVYGMNFKYFPELAWPWAYAAVWIVMIGISGMSLYYFKRQGWL